MGAPNLLFAPGAISSRYALGCTAKIFGLLSNFMAPMVNRSPMNTTKKLRFVRLRSLSEWSCGIYRCPVLIVVGLLTVVALYCDHGWATEWFLCEWFWWVFLHMLLCVLPGYIYILRLSFNKLTVCFYFLLSEEGDEEDSSQEEDEEDTRDTAYWEEREARKRCLTCFNSKISRSAVKKIAFTDAFDFSPSVRKRTFGRFWWTLVMTLCCSVSCTMQRNVLIVS